MFPRCVTWCGAPTATTRAWRGHGRELRADATAMSKLRLSRFPSDPSVVITAERGSFVVPALIGFIRVRLGEIEVRSPIPRTSGLRGGLRFVWSLAVGGGRRLAFAHFAQFCPDFDFFGAALWIFRGLFPEGESPRNIVTLVTKRSGRGRDVSRLESARSFFRGAVTVRTASAPTR